MEKKNTGFWAEMGKPFVVLVVICLVAAGVLGFLNSVTAPIIEETNRKAAEATRMAVLPEAASFNEIDISSVEGMPSSVSSVYEGVDASGNTVGYVFTAANKGYGGDVTVTAGLKTDGSIEELSVDVSSETKGLGSKLADAQYHDLFIGLTDSADGLTLRSGATFTSTAYRSSVNAIFEAFDLVSGGAA